MTREDAFFEAVSARRLVRTSVRAIIINGDRFLVQRPTDDPHGHYAFIGGEYEVGDTFETRIRREFEEETDARVVDTRYLFVVENRFPWRDKTIHALEHYLLVTLDRTDVTSREPHLAQLWLDRATLAGADLRPTGVRDLLLSGDWQTTRHLVI